jgi:predicted  nucleic acid-binding Zn-ribbon protein
MLLRLLALPVTGALDAVAFVGGKIAEAAAAQMNDAEAIKAELDALERRLEAGEIDEADFEAIELGLVRRLQEARRRMAGPA